MAYPQHASCCKHLLRITNLPLEDVGTQDARRDTALSLCSNCEGKLYSELEKAKHRWADYKGDRMEQPSVAYIKIRDQLRAVRIKAANYGAYMQDFARAQRGQSVPNLGLTRRVRFCIKQKHRPEELYRLREGYLRTSTRYVAGVHADKTGRGFVNTSDGRGETTSG